MSGCRTPSFLLVEPDPRITEMLVECLALHFDARLTCTVRGEDALDQEIVGPHDLVLADTDLPGIDGITLARHLMEFSDRPVILTSAQPTLSQAIEAIRLGVCDYVPKPFSIPQLLESVEVALHRHRSARRYKRRYYQMRRMMRRVLTQRRELNERIDLVCRDLVGAHRRLLHRVLEHEQARPG